MTDDELAAKFRDNAAVVLRAADVDELAGRIADIGACPDVTTLDLGCIG